MPKDIAIEVNTISKTYKLYDSHRHLFTELVHPLRRKFHRKFNALKDISFDVKRGEVLGIIGRNGSGKSTLLKILASVVTPTSGSFNCHGRVTALLELGGGFNKDMTGVENVYFLGAIQGFSKKEMELRLQQILDFAEIGEFAYQSVKKYSSGMYVRLAFSIAIHIDPDILVTDEALAVGDLRFQQKCFRKIREFKEAGKTIVICTHSLSVVNEFCTHAIWLHNGKINLEGDPQKVADAYLAFMNSRETTNVLNHSQAKIVDKAQNKHLLMLEKLMPDAGWISLEGLDSFGDGSVKLMFVALLNAQTGNPVAKIEGGEKLRILVSLEVNKMIPNTGIHLIFNDRNGTTVFKINSFAYKQPLRFVENKPTVVAIEFDFPSVGNGRYTISLVALSQQNNNKNYLHWVHDALIVQVANPDVKFKQGSLMVINEATFKTLQEPLVQE